jgi:hypothetical protein
MPSAPGKPCSGVVSVELENQRRNRSGFNFRPFINTLLSVMYCGRVGAEGRISQLKRGYGSGRSRLKGQQGARIWTCWAVLAYNLDTVVRMETRVR